MAPLGMLILTLLPVPVSAAEPGSVRLRRIRPAPMDGPPTTAIALRETLELFTPAIGPKISGSGPAGEPDVRRARTLTALGDVKVGVNVSDPESKTPMTTSPSF